MLALIAWGLFVGCEIALLGIPWLMGVLIGYLPPFPAHRRATRVLAVISALVLLAAGLALAKKMDSLPGDLMLGTIVTLLIWVTLHCAKAPLPHAYVRVARRAARSSYTLYLVHLPLLIFLKASLHLPRGLPTWHSCLIGAGVVAVLVLHSQAVYQVFERNTDSLRQWLKPMILRSRTA